MCRNIKTLANFEPPATDDEVRASAIQFVRKLSGTTHPSKANEEAFARDKGVQYELLYDTNGALTSAVGVSAWPQTLFIDAGGTIVEQTGLAPGERPNQHVLCIGITDQDFSARGQRGNSIR